MKAFGIILKLILIVVIPKGLVIAACINTVPYPAITFEGLPISDSEIRENDEKVRLQMSRISEIQEKVGIYLRFESRTTLAPLLELGEDKIVPELIKFASSTIDSEAAASAMVGNDKRKSIEYSQKITALVILGSLCNSDATRYLLKQLSVFSANKYSYDFLYLTTALRNIPRKATARREVKQRVHDILIGCLDKQCNKDLVNDLVNVLAKIGDEDSIGIMNKVGGITFQTRGRESRKVRVSKPVEQLKKVLE